MRISLLQFRITKLSLSMILFFTAFLPFILIGQIATADTGVIYGSTGTQDGGRLITINTDSGDGSYVNLTHNEFGLPGLAINSNGEMFAIDDNMGLYRVDPQTVEFFYINDVDMDLTPAIAFNHHNELFGIAMEYSQFIEEERKTGGVGAEYWHLIKIDTSNADYDIIMNLPYRDWRGMAFDPTNGRLYASTADGEIYVLNIITGAIQLLSSEIGYGTPDLTFDNNGNLYGSFRDNESSDDFYVMDKNWGSYEIIGDVGISYISGMASRTIPVTGPQLGSFPTIADFKVVGNGLQRKQLLTIWNHGTENLSVTDIVNLADPFTIEDVTFPVIIPADSSFSVNLIFSPTFEGEYYTEIIIVSNDADNPNILIPLSGFGEEVEPGIMFASDNRTGEFWAIDPASGESELIGVLGGDAEQVTGITEIEFHQDGSLFATLGGGYSLVLKIDIFSGEWEILGFHEPGAITGLDFGPNDTLYGTWIPGPQEPSYLVSINQINGAMEFIGATGYSNIRGLTFSANGDYLYGVGPDSAGSDTTDVLLMIDLETGVAAKVGPTGFTNVSSLEFGPDSVLYASISVNEDSTLAGGILQINPQTGVGTFIGQTGAESISGISFFPSPIFVTSITEESGHFPAGFYLDQNYPNPFNPKTKINFNLSKPGFVTLKVYNIIGQLVETLISEKMDSGFQSFDWNAAHIASGIYFYKLQAGTQILVKKAILIK